MGSCPRPRASARARASCRTGRSPGSNADHAPAALTAQARKKTGVQQRGLPEPEGPVSKRDRVPLEAAPQAVLQRVAAEEVGGILLTKGLQATVGFRQRWPCPHQRLAGDQNTPALVRIGHVDHAEQAAPWRVGDGRSAREAGLQRAAIASVGLDQVPAVRVAGPHGAAGRRHRRRCRRESPSRGSCASSGTAAGDCGFSTASGGGSASSCRTAMSTQGSGRAMPGAMGGRHATTDPCIAVLPATHGRSI